SFFKIKTDEYYIWLLKKNSFKNKLLVIDDFDRIEPDKQEQVYKVFNVLENKLPIVFVGDYAKLAKNNSKYLQKIINKQIELPYVLRPDNIWKKYFEDLETKLKISIE